MCKEDRFERVIKYFLCGIVLLQMIFACVWVTENVGIYQEEFLTNNYLKAARTLKVDDYMGILYALLVRVRGNNVLLYFIQLASMVVSATYMSRSFIKDTLFSVIVALFICTNPLLLQLSFVLLPNAFALSVAMMIIAFLYRKKYNCVAFFTLIFGLLNHDYPWLIIAILLPVCVSLVLMRISGAKKLISSLIFSFAISLGIISLTSSPNEYGNVEKSFDFLMMQRFSFGHVNEAREVISLYHSRDYYYEMLAGDRIPENLSLSFGTAIENEEGKDNAEAVYEYMYKLALTKSLGYYGKSVIRDFLFYLFTPFSVIYILMMKITETLIANPTHYLLAENMGVFKFFLTFAVVALAMLSVSVCLYKIYRKLFRTGTSKCISTWPIMWMAICVSFYGMFFCVRGFDYRNSYLVILAWIMIPIITLFGEKVDDNASDNS